MESLCPGRESIWPSIDPSNIIQNNSSAGIKYVNCSSLGTIDNLTVTGNGGYGAFSVMNAIELHYCSSEDAESTHILVFVQKTGVISEQLTHLLGSAVVDDEVFHVYLDGRRNR